MGCWGANMSVVLLILGVVVYFVPAIVADRRKHNNRLAIRHAQFLSRVDGTRMGWRAGVGLYERRREGLRFTSKRGLSRHGKEKKTVGVALCDLLSILGRPPTEAHAGRDEDNGRVVKKLERLEITRLRILHRLPFRMASPT